MKPYDIAIIGGGASGLAASIMARRGGASTVLLERGLRVGRKLLATGNGRCNLTNTRASGADYHGGTTLMSGAMAAFPPEAVMAFFESIGVLVTQTRGGRVYPLCDQAAAVLDGLRLTAAELGLVTLTEFDVNVIDRNQHFRISAADGRSVLARRVIMAPGGPAAPALGGTDAGIALLRRLGHKITRLSPALTPLETVTEPIRALKGIRIDGGMSIEADGTVLAETSGDILFTDYGLSGTAAMAVSRVAAASLMRKAHVEAVVRTLDQPYEAILALLKARRTSMPKRSLEDFLTGVINKRLGQTLIKASGAKPLSRLSESLTDLELETLASLLKGFRLTVTGTRGFANAQVSAGGADCAEFDPDTLMSRLVPGLFACGEALDIDGDCGGFNLQWAWASGLFAAQSAVRSLNFHD